jgi:hypothetical protein
MMLKKTIFFALLFLFIHSVEMIASPPLPSIQNGIIEFLSQEEYRTKRFNLSIDKCTIVNLKTKEQITEDEEGVFAFKFLVSGEYTYILLVNNDSFEIINTEDDVKAIFGCFISSLKKGNYATENIYFYLKGLIQILEQNEKIKKGHRYILYPK